jgi:putative DNA primase/helicase
MITLAQPLMEIPIEDIDKDPYAFNCRNGTIDLRTRELRPHNPKEHITFLADVVYDEESKCPVWLSHLQKIFDGDKGSIEAFQRICGYSLTEVNPEQVMFIAWGNGKNGKSTTFGILQALLGDYAAATKAESFMKSGGNNDARNDLARLYRKRMVVTTEPQSGSKLNESLVKAATGGDTITARFLYQEFFQFAPAFKIFVNTNHRPTVTESDEGLWRRLVMLPFNHVFSESERDRHIDDKLKEEKSGILNWMLDGYKKYMDEDFGGFRLSRPMVDAASEYRNFEDTLMLFIEDRCIMDQGQSVLKRDLYAEFVDWCRSSGEDPANNKRFGLMVHGHFSNVRDMRDKGERAWKGIGLKTKKTAMEAIKRTAQERL